MAYICLKIKLKLKGHSAVGHEDNKKSIFAKSLLMIMQKFPSTF